jgi:lipopolysaccharide/colanic/teichoic acid biosynthesis glycosyltransferase
MKRLFDLGFSLLAILLLLPVWLFLALWIVIDDGLPVFYIQKRVGKGNCDFGLFKFRTMFKGSDKKGLLTVGRDSRITKSGAFLRRFKLDELPQLWNVLKGDMSLVGPRPEVRKYVSLYSAEQMKVLDVAPGITDPVSLEYFDESALLGASTDPEKTYIEEIMPRKLALNLEYLQRRSFFSDLGILWKTVMKMWKA